MRWIVAFFCLFITAASHAQNCVPENEWAGVRPGAPDCCQGLERKIPTDGRMGAVQCVKIGSSCVKEGDHQSQHPQYYKPCCEGLVPFVDPNDRRIGAGPQCVKQGTQACLREGAPIFSYPNAPTCCQGLIPGKPSPQSPIGFADVCIRGVRRVQVNDTEVRKEINIDPGVRLRDDSEVQGQ